MKVNYIELAGRKYPMVLSLSAIQRIEEEFGSMEGMSEALTYHEETGLTAVIQAVETVLGIFLDAGRKYVSAIGEEVPPPLPCRITDVLDMDAMSARDLIGGVIDSGTRREVEAAAKNGVATGTDAAAARGSSSPEPKPD